MNDGRPRIYSFDNFRLEADERVLLRDGEPVVLSSKAFDVLEALVENSGRLVTKDALYDRVWANTIVEDANLAVQISAIRKALGNPDYIQTVKGHGYRFVADVLPHSNGVEQYVVASRRVSKITIEHEDDERPLLQSRRRHALPIVALAIACASLLAAGFATWKYFGSARTESAFRIRGVKKLTSTGRVATAAAISPDGKLFAFSQLEGELESLWIGHTDGGEPKQIRGAAEIQYAALRFEPDGRHIYYVASDAKSRSLFRLPVFGGAPEKIRENIHYNFSFAPDGRRIAYARESPSRLMVADLDSSNEALIASAPTNGGFVRHSPTWSSDGKTIAIGAAVNESGTQYEVFVVDVSTGAMRQLTSHSWGSIDSVVWLGNQSKLIVVGNEFDSRIAQLWQVSFPSGEVKPLTSDLSTYDYTIDSSANSEKLLTIQLQQHSNIWLGDVDRLTNAKQITFSSLGRNDGWSGLDWTADRRIVYTAVVDKISSIWSMAEDGTDQRQLTPSGQSSYHPSVSDDGHIVFSSRRSGRYSIWRMNDDGSDAIQLVDVDVAAQPHISPDGNWVFFIGDRDGFGSLYRVASDGGAPTMITETPACWIRVSPDSAHIAGGFRVEGKTKLGIMSVEGGEFEQLFEVPRTANLRLGVRWRSDGKAIAYRDWANGIWLQKLDGDEPTRISGLPEEKFFAFDFSPDGKRIAFSRGNEIRDVVLITGEK